MGLLDALRGRTRQIEPNLESFFALPSAAITLESACSLVHSGQGAICYKAATGAAQTEASSEMDQLAGSDLDALGLTRHDDDLGFTWLVVADPDLASLVTRLHAANTVLTEHGLGPHLLCAVIGFAATAGTSSQDACYLVYLFKRGTFYPFAPRDGERRDNELELRVRAEVAGELPIEPDLSRWMALWGLPVT